MKNIQLVKWYPEWHGIHFIMGNPLRQPEAFHLIYKWSIYLGWWELRKFLTDKEMKQVYKIYKQHNNGTI